MNSQQEWISSVINDFLLNFPENTLENEANEKAWIEAIVGFSNGADPIFEAYKEHVGPFHFTPYEIFSHTFPSVRIEPEQLTVISYILPQTVATKTENRREKLFPSERWVRARIYGEEVNRKIRQTVVDALQKAGYKAVAPMGIKTIQAFRRCFQLVGKARSLRVQARHLRPL